MTIRVLLADDHAVVRDGLRMLLEAQGDIHVLGTVPDGRQAVTEARRLSPDIVVMDVGMPELNGIDAAGQIIETVPQARVLILSSQSAPAHVHRALRAGVRGYLLKEAAGTELVAAVRALHAGRRYLSAEINDAVLADFAGEGPKGSPLDQLSPRERQVLQLVVEGRTNAEVAQKLSLSVKTVETYRSRLMQKLGIKDLPALVKFAIEHGLTQVG